MKAEDAILPDVLEMEVKENNLLDISQAGARVGERRKMVLGKGKTRKQQLTLTGQKEVRINHVKTKARHGG